MRRTLSRRTIYILLAIIVLIVAIPVTLYLLNQQQDIRQHAAGGADLVVKSLELTDAGGNVKTQFGVNEDIYVRITLKNQGSATGVSSDSHTYTTFYSNAKTAVAPNTASDVNIVLRNGQFAAGSQKTYESKWNGLNDSYYTNKIYFSQSKGGTYHARAYINYDGKVSESDATNNQLDLTYTVTGKFIANGVYLDGDVSSSPPSGFSSSNCGEQGTRSGVTACYNLGPLNGKSVVKLTNTSSQTQTVGVSLYKAYYPFPNPYPSCSPTSCPDQFIWAWTQTIYSAQVLTLNPGDTRYVSLPIPSCYWQVDAFIGSTVLLSFHPGQTNGELGTLIGGGWLEQYNGINACTPVIPPLTPTPSPTSTPTPVPSNAPTPTVTETPTPTLTETPTPSETPTPTVPVCPVPSQVQNVRVVCPFCGQ
jgi:hypothetical protein